MTRELFQICFVTLWELNSQCAECWQCWHVLRRVKWDVKDWASRVREFPLQMIAEPPRPGFHFVQRLDKHTQPGLLSGGMVSGRPLQPYTQEDGVYSTQVFALLIFP